MGWIARRSGRVPLPPAQAGGALCPRARGGSARTNICEGSTSRRIIQQSAFCAIFHFTRGALCPGKLRKMWNLILYIFGAPAAPYLHLRGHSPAGRGRVVPPGAADRHAAASESSG